MREATFTATKKLAPDADFDGADTTMELADGETVDSKSPFHVRPRGRAPRGLDGEDKLWNYTIGMWQEVCKANPEECVKPEPPAKFKRAVEGEEAEEIPVPSQVTAVYSRVCKRSGTYAEERTTCDPRAGYVIPPHAPLAR
jgi:hypothetical protein